MLGLVKLHFSYFKSIHPWQTCSLIKLFILIVPLRGTREQESYCFWLRGVHCAVCTVQCAACSVQCAACSVQCAVCSVHCAVCSVQCAVCSVHCAVCSVHCALCSVQCAVWHCKVWLSSVMRIAELLKTLIEPEFENIFSFLSGAQMALTDEKWRVDNIVTHSL